MTYSTLRDSIWGGDLIAWQGTGLGSKLIRWATKSPWTHVGIACWWGPRLMVLESYPGVGTRAHPLSHDLKGAYWVPVRHGLEYSFDRFGMDFALGKLDLKYSWLNDWKALWGMDLVKRQYQCAQYAADVLSQSGIDGLPTSATPASLVAFFEDANIRPLAPQDTIHGS